MIERALVREGTFKIKKKIILRSQQRNHLITGKGLKVLLPDDYLLFGHFLPQLVPFLIRNKGLNLALNMVIPDNINRNFDLDEIV